MKIAVKSLENQKIGEIDTPIQFQEEIREDIIGRAVHALQSAKRQKYGAKEDAGLRPSAELSRRRKKYRGSYGHGISRIPRKIMSRRGTRFNWIGAVAPGTVGGRRAHPPKSEKNWEQKINTKERRKAMRSALSATLDKDMVQKRGHTIPQDYPFIIDTKIEDLQKTKDVKKTLQVLGLKEDLLRTAIRAIRSGKAKLRGRKYKTKKGPLLVVGDNCNLLKSARNVSGVDIVHVKNLNTELLAPGCHAGRLTVFTQKAIDKMQKEKLFM